MKFSKRVSGLRPSPVFELLKKSKQMKAEGKDIISLSVGELDKGTYEPIKAAGKKAIDENYTKYTGSAGRESFREQIANQFSSIYNWDIKMSNVAISAGCKYALFVIFQTLCNPDDEVVFQAPYWMSYPDIIGLSGARSVIVPTDEKTHFKITASQLEKAITPKTKIFLLNSPNNPTSSIHTEEELKELGEVLKKHPQVLIVTDDIYDQIVFSGDRAPHFYSVCPDLKDRVIAVNGASKNYLMTGWRLGWVFGPADFIKIVSSFQSQSISCVNSIAQKAAEDSLHLCQKDLKNMVSELKELRDFFSQGLQKIPLLKVHPSKGAFYLWVGVQGLVGKKYKDFKIQSSKDVMNLLLEEKYLVCLPGEEFGTPGYLRFTYGLKKEILKKAISRLSEFVSDLT
ncbi:MAG: pyridoxal phosphate-dependent aminotransferase [Bdellovibrionales bacterium]